MLYETRVCILFPPLIRVISNTTSEHKIAMWKTNELEKPVFATFNIILGQDNLKYCLVTDWCIMFHH